MFRFPILRKCWSFDLLESWQSRRGGGFFLFVVFGEIVAKVVVWAEDWEWCGQWEGGFLGSWGGGVTVGGGFSGGFLGSAGAKGRGEFLEEAYVEIGHGVVWLVVGQIQEGGQWT